MANQARISGWVETEVKAQFIARAKANDMSESGLVGLLVKTFLNNNPDESHDAPTDDARKTERQWFRLNPAERALLKARAKQRHMRPATYARATMRAHLYSAPQFDDEELACLRDANRQLASLGRNINQIARALNTSLDNAHLAQAVNFSQLRAALEDHRKVVMDLVKANMDSWEVGNGS